MGWVGWEDGRMNGWGGVSVRAGNRRDGRRSSQCEHAAHAKGCSRSTSEQPVRCGTEQQLQEQQALLNEEEASR